MAFNSFSNFFDLEISPDEDPEERKNVIQSIHNDNEKAFNKKWNWLLLCKSVSEYLFEPFFTTMKRNLFEVLTFGSLLKEQVEIIKNRTTNG